MLGQDSKEKALLLQKIDILEKNFSKLDKRYKKTNKDRLSAAHLLTKVNEELEDSLSNEKRFIASVSHELRTPLTAILGYGELLSDTALNNRQQRYLDSMIQSSNHLLALVSDLLDVAKLGDNRIELSPKEIDFDDILNDCANLIRSKISDGVDFVIDIPMLDYKLKADDKRIKQIFINLLSNAAKFTKKGTIRFYVKELEELEDKKLKVVVNIDDTGGGIPHEIEDRLFDPFQSTDKTQGTGLGLFISRQFAVLMNGDISVDSKEGEGSSFSTTLILDRCSKKEIGKKLCDTNIMMFSYKDEFVKKISKEFLHLGVNFKNHDISNEDITAILITMMASGKFYDVAIFDVDMFKENTSSIAGTLKTINPNIKLLALTGKTSDKDLAFFDQTLSKPIIPQRLIKNVEELYSNSMGESAKEVDYSNLKILIVEDVELNREFEKEMLNKFFSIECDTAENGKVALEKAKEHRYDAILMDMRMPVMDGLDSTRAIREFDKTTPIICMSANVYKEDKIAAEESGMNDFIEKPLERVDIENKLLRLINNEFNLEEKEIGKKIDPNNVRDVAMVHLQKSFNDKTAGRLLVKAIESIEQYLVDIEQNFKDENSKGLVENFHALKGVLFNLGLNDFAKQAGELQKLSASENWVSMAEPKQEFISSIRLDKSYQ
jgi:CheY-like chemotaxis protein